MEIPRVLLIIETSRGYGRRLLEGIGRYVREHGPWSLFCEARGLHDRLPSWVRGWRGEGIVARTTNAAMARRLRDMEIPMVELLGRQADEPSKIHGDNASAGRLAAEHLMQCGLKNFGFFACGESWWLSMYREGFQETLRRHGCACDVYIAAGAKGQFWPRWHSGMRAGTAKWLRSLPKPAGIFAPSPDIAANVLNICRSEKIDVPEQIAVLSGGDDPALCSVFTPPLSCVDFAVERIGYDAAGMLQRLMAGEPPPLQTIWIPATHVVQRQSTDLIAIEDADVALAVRFIREHACRGIGVPDVATHTGLSRRMLELKFRQFLDRTPKDMILKVRMERAQLLLSESQMSIEAIAKNSGFASPGHFAGQFYRELGVTPRAFRRRHHFHREIPARDDAG